MNRPADPAPIDGDDGLEDLSDAALTDFVAAYHEQLLSGRPIDGDDEGVTSSNLESSRHWQAVKRVLEALARARQGSVDARPDLGDGASRFSWADFSPRLGDPGEPVQLTRLGRFTIERELGRGGLSVVYLAHDPVLRRNVALKVPRPEALLTAEARSRFQREAQAAARLTHPNLVAVYEVGEAGPIAYIASALCAGPNLADWLHEGRAKLNFRTAAGIVLSLAEAIDYAHGQGVLHRDIKPSNVLLEPKPAADPSDAFPYVSRLGDFGLARVHDLGDDATRTGLVLGTPGYMSPEQAEGRPNAIGPTTDVYGLGALLYELLVGKAPCGGSSHAEAIRRAVFDEPRRPRSIRAEIPRDLEAICLKCLEKRPERRYASALDLAADLNRFLAGEPTRARPLRAWRRAGRWAKRRPAVAGLLGVSMLAALTAAGFGVLYTLTLQRSLEEMRQFATPVALREAQYLMGQGAYSPAQSLLEEYAPSSDEESAPFAWRYLQRLAVRRPLDLPGHRGDVYAVTFSPDEATIASAGQDHTVRLWQAADGRPLARLEGHANEVNSVAYSLDGKWLYSVDDDGKVRLWDAVTRTPRGNVAQLPGRGWGLVVSREGPTLWCLSNVHAGPKNTIHLWTIGSDGSLIDPASFVGYAALLAPIDEQHVLGLDGLHQKLIVYGRDGEQVFSGPNVNLAMVLAADWTHQRVAFCASDGRVGYLLQPDWLLDASWDSYATRIESGAFLRDEFLATGAGDGLLRIWGAHSTVPIDTLPKATGRLWALSSTRNGQRLAVAGQAGHLAVWDFGQHAAARQWSRQYPIEGIFSANLSPNGSQVAVAFKQGDVGLFDCASGAELVRITSGGKLLHHLRIAEDSRHLAWITLEHEAQVWDLSASPPRQTYVAALDPPPKDEPYGEDIAFRPGGESFLVGPLGGRIQEIESGTGRVLRTIELPSRPIESFVLDRGDPEIVAMTIAGGLEVEREGGFFAPEVGVELQDKSLTSPALPSQLLMVPKDNTIALLRKPELSLHSTIALESRIRMVAKSPHGNLIAAQTADGALHLVDCRVREEVLRLPGFAFGGTTIAFSSDGAQLICVGWDAQEIFVRSWDCR